MIVERWNSNYVKQNPKARELNELKVKEFIGRLSKDEENRLAELREECK